jgi:hypothetical protein
MYVCMYVCMCVCISLLLTDCLRFYVPVCLCLQRPSRTTKKMAKIFQRQNHDLLSSHYAKLRGAHTALDDAGDDADGDREGERAGAGQSDAGQGNNEDDEDDLLVVKQRHPAEPDPAITAPDNNVRRRRTKTQRQTERHRDTHAQGCTLECPLRQQRT